MLYKALGSDTIVYITKPTWSNHRQVFESVGFPVEEFTYSSNDIGLDMPSILSTLNTVPPKSIFVFHASAHNPSGCDPSPEQWKAIGKIVKERNLFPIFDSAYLGMTSGYYEKDAFAIRYFVEELHLEVAVCLSFAKSMGLYGMTRTELPLKAAFQLQDTNTNRRTCRSMCLCFTRQHCR